MALQKYVPSSDSPSVKMKPLRFSTKVQAQFANADTDDSEKRDVDVDLREVYFLIMHFLSISPCRKTYGQLWNELLENQLLPRRYHAWYSRAGEHSGQENDDGMSFPLSYAQLVQRNPHIETDHLIKLLKQLLSTAPSQSEGKSARHIPNAADVPTLLGTGSFSLLSYDGNQGKSEAKHPPVHMRWPHMHADQVRGLGLREIGGGFTRHHRAPSIRAACYAIAEPSTMVQKMQNIKRLRGHRNAVYCAIFDRSGRYVITGSDDRLVKIWSMETAYCLASCRGHEGDITDLAVNSNNFIVASASNDCIIRVWHLPDGQPISVLRGHTGAVTAIAFSPRPGSVYQLLSSSDDGTCRIWDARNAEIRPRIYVPKPSDSLAGKNSGSSSTSVQQSHQIFCCAFNANGTVFVTGSSDTLARVWIASKPNADDSDQPIHEIDVLAGHENDVNYVQFSGCSVSSRYSTADCLKEESVPKFRNSWFSQDNIVTCSRDGSAIIWIPRSRRSHGKVGRWCKHYHLKVPPPPLPPQPPRGGPRQRILPTPRGVNMIIWSLDNRFVLAAIMDCRICVWNAADGSLVHSLSGHTDSTYVLDVHPFNPRIAMSAGYDGRTIVWDIWEGTPIRIYEIARFKLVDGKFSSDGTSIILSDDVGQLYILNTGQGESQKDAKYDQFFLGDFRPLIHDTSGNSLDLETQLTTYRRNMQDLLCDSGMIPYTEPYQTMYQKRRLGALGLEWKPCALNLSVGPNFTLDQDYQIPPLADLDAIAAPLPAFLDAMDWEPEIEVQSDDNDSEYNVIEEYSTGGEQGSLGYLSGDPECSTENSEIGDTHKDPLRRSKRKKLKAEIEFMTSSGRRVKRRNLDECDGNSFSNGPIRKSKNERKALRRRSSTSKTSSKSSRPRRAAARNAFTLFSKITGTSTDGEDEYDSEGDSSDSESMIQDSYIESDESDGDLPNGQIKLSKGKEVFFGEPEDVAKTNVLPESHNAGNRRRLVLKLPARNPNKLVLPESTIERKVDVQKNSIGLSWKASEEATEGGVKHISSPDMVCSSVDANNTMIGRVSGQSDKVEDHLDLIEGYKNGGHGAIKWGGVKARTSRRLKLGEPVSSDAHTGSMRWLGDHKEKENVVNGYVKPEKACATVSLDTDIKTCKEDIIGKVTMLEKNLGSEVELRDDPTNAEDHSGPSEHIKYPESPKWVNRSFEDIHALTSHLNGQPYVVKEGHMPISTKLRIFSKSTTIDNENPGLKLKLSRGHANGGNDALNDSSSERAKDIVSEVPLVDRFNDICSDNEGDGFQELDAQVDLVGLLPDSKKMYNVVYRRSKTQRDRSNSENAGAMVASTTIESNLDRSMIEDLHEGSTNGAPIKRSSRLKGHELQSEDVHRSIWGSSTNGSQLPTEEWGSSSRMAVRSTRNRRSNSYFNDPSPIRKPSQSARKGSWLMMTTHEEGSRYIPQLSDEIVYLRQGHQEYTAHTGLKETGPWTSSKGGNMLRAVEFCRVEGLEYSTSPGSGDSRCKMTLKFTDPSSSMFDRSFNLTFPDMTSFPDFMVERTRFDAAMNKGWSPRAKCKVWWKDDSGDGGSWWDGRIVAVQAKSCEFPDSPWESFTVRYRSEPTKPQLHSPWELFDADMQWEQPHIDIKIRDNLLLAFTTLEKSSHEAQDQYAVNKLKQVSQKSNFTNRYPVPLSIDVIQCRLENNYYRTLDAVQHDIQVMLSNAESYFGRNAELLSKLRRLSEFFSRTFSSLQPS
ncbi:LOW QUALITY PROTEIN: bromodomain and WD repeat-containing protein 3-like [Hibiscus syriacus]|uniref:LOW QUALITY PROTEIN: bromodomain and WD repeat-containing protein 3-like n=1 Tax=Hibiscus syriacus TaxID=106335 RepID=UPI0019216E0F|nr:LOW QUALITY PROTEIN: bromodomain and WD repeat-containing protein 3-like [Hibiscus syriacus]